ncbi:MAG: putative C-S lyase [Myxococcales bacterium]|nr:putative C-S lyase [Myxococcales bacterium]
MSERFDVDLEVRRRTQGEKWQHYPPDVLPLWVADMDFGIAPAVRDALCEALEIADFGYPRPPRETGIPELFAARMAERFAWSVDPSLVEILCEVVQGIYVALLQFTEPGDGVLVQTPIYPPFLSAIRETGRRLVEAPLRDDGSGYRVDLDASRAACDEGTKVLLLCNPHNPTGRVFDRAELEGLAELALERDLQVVSDEIHADLVYPGAVHRPFASLGPEISGRTTTLYSASKAFNIAGLRCAVAAFGARAALRRFRELPHHVRGGLSQPGLVATRAAWERGGPWLDEVLKILRGNRDFTVEEVSKRWPGARVHRPEATYLAWVDTRPLRLQPSPYAHFLERGRVAFSDGAHFGTPGEHFVRINFATSRAVIDEGIERAARSLPSC